MGMGVISSVGKLYSLRPVHAGLHTNLKHEVGGLLAKTRRRSLCKGFCLFASPFQQNSDL